MWRELADNVKYGLVEMAIDSAVGMFAGIHPGFSIVLCDLRYGTRMLYVTLSLAGFMVGAPRSLFGFLVLSGITTDVFMTSPQLSSSLPSSLMI